jgi:hypothetical protein
MSKDDMAKVGHTIKNLPKRPQPQEPAPIALEDNEADAKDKVRQTLHLPVAVHEQLRELAFRKRMSQQKLFKLALDLLFKAEQAKSWDELAPPKSKG